MSVAGELRGRRAWARVRAAGIGAPRGLALLLAVLLATGGGCGDHEAAPAATSPARGHDRAGPPLSAFQFQRTPEGVRHDIPLEQVRQGIPGPDPRDRIPAILEPRLLAVAEATHVRDEERVLVVHVRAQARAYPLRILDAHELVNDVVGGEALLVTWCPLCRSALVFEREVAGAVRRFGVSGFLYRSAVLMYDHDSETFWSQIAGRAVVGPLTGTRLTPRPARVTTFAAFRAEFPDGQVLGPEQPGRTPADYQRGHYDDYHARPGLMFQVDAYDRRLALKDEVVGVEVGGASHAWSLAWIRAQPSGPLALEVGGQALTLRYESVADAVRLTDAQGREVAHLRAYWFAWYAFHQDTGLTGLAPR